MRRKDREVTDFSKVLEVIDSCDCCRLGLIDEAQEAYIVPLNFGYESENGNLILYFHGSSTGKKMDLIAKQHRASFEMDTKHHLVSGDTPCKYSYLYQCVMGKGEIEILHSPDDKLHGLERIMAHYASETRWDFRPEMVERVSVFKLIVREWSCKVH